MRLLAIALLVALAGCAGTTTSELEAVDRSVFVPSARVAIDIAPARDARPSEPHTSHAIELGITGGGGNDTQELFAGSLPIRFGGQTFTQPASLSHDFDFRFVELAYRYRHFFGAGKSFGIEALGGLAYADLDLTTTSGAQRASESLQTGGIVGSFGIIWRFRQTTSLQSRILGFASGDNEGISGLLRTDVYVVQAFGSHAALRAGWSAWNIRSSREANDASGSILSPISVRFSGPALGLDLMF